jgi:cellulose synthase/poly-beta-1,6-N-acetylglucosamine synthase-like glycosyltransferase
MIAVLFWSSLALIVYTYAAFPALVALRARLCRQPYLEADITPPLSVIIVAHNEAAHIAQRLDNLLELDYPREQLELIVASDGSDDATESIVERYASQGVRLLTRTRQGKIPALNAAASEARGAVLVFSDANSRFAGDALRALVRPLADPRVGGVAGDQRHTTDRPTSSAGEREYWNFDRRLKQWESAAGSAISATGAIYAVRRELFQPVPGGVTDDFTLSTGVIAQGYRLVFCPAAVAYEPVAPGGRAEFARKVRIANRGLRAVWARRELLDPRRYGFYALQLLSHKVLRRLMVYPLLVLLVTSGLGAARGRLDATVFAAQAVFYACAGLGLLLEHRPWGQFRALALPYHFCLVNAACLWASLELFAGRRVDCWTPHRRATATPEPAQPRSTTPCCP